MFLNKIINKKLLVPVVCLIYVILSREIVDVVFGQEVLIFLSLLMLDVFIFLFVPHILLWHADKIKKFDGPEINNSLGEISSQFLLTMLLARLACLVQIIVQNSGVGEFKVLILLSFSVILIGTRLFVLYYLEKNLKQIIVNLILFILIIFYHQMSEV